MATTVYLKGVRTRYRNTLTAEIRNATEIMSRESTQYAIEQTVFNATKCLEKIKTYSEKLELQSEKLVSATDESDGELIEEILNDDCKLCSVAMDTYIDLKHFKDRLFSIKQKEHVKEDKEDDPVTNKLVHLQEDMQTLFLTQMKQQETTEKQAKERQSTVKLPKIEMISFNGDKTRWVEFWDSFQSAVHNNKTLSNIERFNYLRSKLTGEAKGAIAGLALSNDNYAVAVQILLERFGNSQEIVDLHYNHLINMHPATNKVSSLRNLLDTVQRHLRSLEALKQNVNQDVFVSMIRSKLPEDVLLQLEIQNGTDNKWSVLSLTKRLHDYVVASERAGKDPNHANGQSGSQSSSSMPTRITSHRKPGVSERKFNSTTQTLISTGTKPRATMRSSERQRVIKCRYCQQHHWSDECKQYQTISERKDRIKGSCYKCLKDSHSFKACKTNKPCVYCGEMNVHHRSLCPKKFLWKHSVAHVVNEMSNQDITVEESGMMSTNETVLMQTALTEIRNPVLNSTAQVRLFLDSGSHRSYITQALAKKLQLKEEGEQDLHVVTFGSTTAKKITTKYTKLDVKLKNGKHMKITANIVPSISGALQRRPVKDLWSNDVQNIVKSVVLADVIPMKNETAPIELLIGNDYYLDFVHGEKIKVQDGLYLLASKLGWNLSGRLKDSEEIADESGMLILTCGANVSETNVFSSIDSSLPVKTELEDFWNIESIGIFDRDDKSVDMIAMDKFRETLKFENNRYYVNWPWKSDEPDLPTNKELAVGRLRSSVQRMVNKPDILQKYDAVVSDQLEKGVIEKVEPTQKDGILHYLPHHAVIKPDRSTTKLRVVYDASAKTRKEHNSLNDCLYRGPVMLHDLCGLLMRFRLHPVAIVADIEKAFLQIGLQRDQRDITRFLWLKDIDNPTVKNDNIQEYRFCRVPFGIVSSPFLLGATIEYHLDSYNSNVADKVKGGIYVDNLITGTNTVAEAHELYTVSKTMFREGAMNLREWISNNKEFNETLSKEDKADIDSSKVLGHQWNVTNDTLSFKISDTVDDLAPVTKRSVLRHVASLFDPLGLMCPVVLRGKVFLQQLWKTRVDWNEHLAKEDRRLWFTISRDMDKISECAVERCISAETQTPTEYRLLCFCDASEKAYATVIYLHITSEKGSATNLVFAKTRLAPVKKMSVPRLELLAVVIGLRCTKFVKDQLKIPITQIHLWSDSQCVLHWIISEKQTTVFVRNRVKEIRECSDVILAYVPTKENPADVASRGTTTVKLRENGLWWNGPAWLTKHPDEWPQFNDQLDDNSNEKFKEEIRETKKTTSLVQTSSAVCANIQHSEVSSPFGINCSDFSSLTKLLRVTVLALRFVRKLQKRYCEKGHITCTELQEARNLWCKSVQENNYKDVFDAIKHGRKTSIQNQLGLFVDQNGLLRCKGRLENACLSKNARFPILLPPKDCLTQLLIEKTHKEILHSGVSQTLSAVRMRSWIPHGRATIKKVLSACTVCRRVEGGPYKMPPMCAYPSARVTEATPFSRVGLDYMGPLYVKTDISERKVWICLFTCLVTRAIHLELVCDMSTAEFLMCFRRFIAQRGTPSELISDNAAHFRAASNILDRIWNKIHKDEDILNYVSNAGIVWKYNVELAPWMGGFYERLVGLVKRSLRKSVGRRKLTMVQLQTLLEIESVLNSRPLVYIGDDINSLIPITPSHFLTLNPNIGIPQTEITNDNDYLPVDSSAEKLLQIWKKGQNLLDMFWNIWRHEYLVSLRERTQTNLKTGRVHSSFSPKVNDVVIIKDDCARGSWKFGKVTKLITSKDGYTRSAKVVVPSGKEIRRPLNLLYPLEVTEKTTNDSVTLDNTKEQKETQEKVFRQQRRAAKEAAKNIRKIITQEADDQ